MLPVVPAAENEFFPASDFSVTLNFINLFFTIIVFHHGVASSTNSESDLRLAFDDLCSVLSLHTMHAHTRTYTHEHTHTHANTHTHTHTYSHARARAHARTYAHMHTCTHARTYTHALTHARARTYTHQFIH